MANDIDKTSPHYKGEFGSIYEVNQKFPSGGVEGDYVAINGWAHYWNADRGTWCVNAQRDSYWDELITNIIEHFKTIKGDTYMGVAGLDTVPQAFTGAKMYYFATVAGTYKNFGGLVVPQGINVLYSENGKNWVNSTLLEVTQELGVSMDKVMSQKAVNTELGKKFDKENIVQESGEAEDKVMSQKVTSENINLMLNSLSSNSSSKNLFNRFDLAYNGRGCYIAPETGKVKFRDGASKISHLINIKSDVSSLTVSSKTSLNAVFGYRFFDSDFNIINFGAFDNSSKMTVSIPENAVYFQFSYSVNSENIQVEYGDTVTAYEEYNSEYEQKIKDVKEPIENINTKVSDLSDKTKDISSDNEVLGDIDEIDFCDDENNVVHSICKDSASFKNLKSNGQNVLTAKDIEGKADKDKSIIVQKESLAAGDEITLEENHIHSCKRIMFTANINSVGTIEVGVGKKEYWASWFEITETNITLKSYLKSEYNPNISFTHGLTLKNNIQFIIDVDDKGNVDLRLTSSGNSYVGHISVDKDTTKTTHNWLGVKGKIRATSMSASLSDCCLSFTCDGYYKEIQVYGDSYINVLNERMAYFYLAQNGYNRNIMLNAFPGEKSSSALADLKLNLKYSAPKRILWAMGMNDLDVNEATPSKNWLNSVNEFLSICKENNIIPILATIPSVVGGYSEDSGIGDKRIHKAKNDWVRSSGYRYVDFAKAVGANDVTGYWFNNGESDDMLESGSMRVHPTKYGGVALYHQLITDFPEILMK
mgnify:CR=1 FL=1